MTSDGLQEKNDRLKDALEFIEALKDQEIAKVEKRLAQAYKDAYKIIEAEIAKVYASSGGDLGQARKYGRLKAMEAAIGAEYAKLTKTSIKETGAAAAIGYATGAYGSRWAYDSALGVEVAWPILPVNAIRESVKAEVAGEDYQTR